MDSFNNFGNFIDSDRWSNTWFLVPVTDEEIEKAKKSALQEYDDVTQAYLEYGLSVSYARMLKNRADFIKSINTGEGFYPEGSKMKVYWWSFGYGFTTPVILSICSNVEKCNKELLCRQDVCGYEADKDGARKVYDCRPYKSLGLIDLYRYRGSDILVVKSSEAFEKVVKDERSKKYIDNGEEVKGFEAKSDGFVAEALEKVKELFKQYPNGILTFSEIENAVIRA